MIYTYYARVLTRDNEEKDIQIDLDRPLGEWNIEVYLDEQDIEADVLYFRTETERMIELGYTPLFYLEGDKAVLPLKEQKQ